MSNSYDVYVGNLSVTISREKLRNLFFKIGEIVFVWINQKHQRFTYAFVAFYHLFDAKKACEQFNNRNLDGFIIKVNLSIKTKRKLLKTFLNNVNVAIFITLLRKTLKEVNITAMGVFSARYTSKTAKDY